MSWSDEDLNLALAEWRDDVPVAAPRRMWWRWAWAPALAAGLLVWALIPAETVIEPPPLLARAPAAPELPVRRATAPSRSRLESAPKTRVSTEFVKLVTDDPDVVILWAMNTEGDGK